MSKLNKENVKKYITGKFSKRQLTHNILPILVSGFSILLFLAWLLYPPELEYSIFERNISNLGSIRDNPNGWFFLSIAFFFMFSQLIPIFLYMHRRLTKISKYPTFIGTVLTISGSIIFFQVGYITEDPFIWANGWNQGFVHGLIAIIGAALIALGLLFYLLPILKDFFFKSGSRQFPLFKIFIAYGFLVLLGVFLTVVQTTKAANNIPEQGAGFLAFSFWEWNLMFGGLLFLVLFCFSFPEEVKCSKP